MSVPLHKLPGSPTLSGVILANTTSKATALKVNLTAITDPGVGNDSSQGYGVGSMWVNTSTDVVWLCGDDAVGASVWGSTGTGNALAVSAAITAVNTFGSGNVIKKTVGGYALAQADSLSNAKALGVIQSASGASFVVVYAGKCTVTAHGFTIGATLYLSSVSAGLLTETEPTTRGQVSKPVAIVLDANTLIIVNQRGILIPASNTGYTATALSAGGTISITPISSNQNQKISGVLLASQTINLLRTNAVAGDKFKFNLAGITTTSTITLTFQENSAGALVFFPNASAGSTVYGDIEFIFNGISWEVNSQNTTENE